MKSEYINNWHRVWNNRKLKGTNKATILEKLISIDGFDSPLGMMSESDWKKYIKLVLERYNINKEGGGRFGPKATPPFFSGRPTTVLYIGAARCYGI